MRKLKLKEFKKRDPIAFNMVTSGLYKQRIVQSKKVYNRKKLKKGKDLLNYLSLIFLSHYDRPIKNFINSISPTISIYLPCG